MGTGATGVAALEAGRELIGIELDEGYAQAASRRLGVRLEKAEPHQDTDVEKLLDSDPPTDPTIEALLA